MSDKIKRVYEALLDGAEAGLKDDALFAYVIEHAKKASSKRIVKASLLALSDPDVKDAKVLEAIYALAIKHRLDPVSADDIDDAADEAVAEVMPRKKKKKKDKDGDEPEQANTEAAHEAATVEEAQAT